MARSAWLAHSKKWFGATRVCFSSSVSPPRKPLKRVGKHEKNVCFPFTSVYRFRRYSTVSSANSIGGEAEGNVRGCYWYPGFRRQSNDLPIVFILSASLAHNPRYPQSGSGRAWANTWRRRVSRSRYAKYKRPWEDVLEASRPTRPSRNRFNTRPSDRPCNRSGCSRIHRR